MSRTLTAIATAIWVAPAVGVAVGYFISTDPFPPARGLTGGDRVLGVGIATYLGGFLAGALAFAATALAIRAYLPEACLRHAQIASGIGIAAVLVWAGAAFLGSVRHYPPEYAGSRDARCRNSRAQRAAGWVLSQL